MLSMTPHASTSSLWQMFANTRTLAIASPRSTQLGLAYTDPANLENASGTPTSQASPTGSKPKRNASNFAWG